MTKDKLEFKFDSNLEDSWSDLEAARQISNVAASCKRFELESAIALNCSAEVVRSISYCQKLGANKFNILSLKFHHYQVLNLTSGFGELSTHKLYPRLMSINCIWRAHKILSLSSV